MYSSEVLSQLRSLNWLQRELKRLPQRSPESRHLESQVTALRERLPNSILSYHDRFEKKGKASAVEVSGNGCPACHLKLPLGLLGELGMPGRFGVCPTCGVFLWKNEKEQESMDIVVAATKRSARRAGRGQN